jgi:hypothetical protein
VIALSRRPIDVEEYIDEGVVTLAGQSNGEEATLRLNRTFELLDLAAGADALKRYEHGHHSGKASLVGLEGIAVGVSKNLDAIAALPSPSQFVRDKLQTFWSQPQALTLTSPGLRGTTRIQRTVPFGQNWFRP